MAEKPAGELGLVRYDAMCTAIAECYSVDEVKELRDKAKALEVYARQAQNKEAERKAAEIRIRAERRAGQLLQEMMESSLRESRGGDRKSGRSGNPESKSRKGTLISGEPGPVAAVIPPVKLADLGITKKQSSAWQQLAAVPEQEFEKAVIASMPPTATRPGEESGTELAARRDRIRHLDVTAADLEEEMRTSGRWDAREAMWTLKLLAFAKGGRDIVIRQVRILEVCPQCGEVVEPLAGMVWPAVGRLWHERCWMGMTVEAARAVMSWTATGLEAARELAGRK